VVAAIGAVNLFVSAATTFFYFRARRASPPQFFLFGAQPEGAENGSNNRLGNKDGRMEFPLL